MKDFRVECELVTNVWESISPDVLDRVGVKWRRGIFEHGPLALVAAPGKMSFSLNNAPVATRPDWMSTLSGRYSPGHPNIWTDDSPDPDPDGVFRHGTHVRLRVGVDYHYRQLVEAHSPGVYYRLDETSGTTAKDLIDSVIAHDGTYSGGITFGQDGAVADGNLAVDFDGIDAQIRVGAAPNDAVFNDRWTLEAWIKTSTTGVSQPIIARFNGSASRPQLLITAGNKLQIRSNDGSTTTTVTGATTLTDGEWHLVQATYDGRNLRIYVDGAPDASPVAADPFHDSTAAHYFVGQFNSTDFFDGVMDEVAIYFHALSSSQVAEKWDARNFAVGYADMVLLNNATTYHRLGDLPTGNYVLRSEQIDNASWGKTNVSVTADVSAVPGRISPTADAIIENTSNAQHNTNQTGLSTDLPATGNVLAKIKVRSIPDAPNARNVRLLLLENGSNFGGAIFNLATEVITETDAGNIDVIDSSITDLGDGWHECEIVVNQTAGAVDQIAINALDGTTASYTGDGESGIEVGEVHVWHRVYHDAYVATTSAVVENDTAADEAGNADGTYLTNIGHNEPGALSDGDTGVTMENPAGAGSRNRRVDVPSVPALGASFTLCGWVRHDTSGSAVWLSGGLPLIGRSVVSWRDSGGTQRTISIGQTLNTGTLYFVAFTHDGTTARVYVDGVETNSDSTWDTESVASTTWNIGTHTNTTVESLNGLADDAALFDYAVTAEQVSKLYAARLSELAQGAGKLRYPFAGRLESIRPTPGTDGEQSVACTAVDWMGDLAASKPAMEVFFEDPTQDPPQSFAHHTGELFGDLKEEVPSAAFGSFTFGVQDKVIMIAFDDLGGRRVGGTQIAQKISETDLSLFFARGDGVAGLTVEVLSPAERSNRAASPDAVFTGAELRDPDGIVVPSAHALVVNDVIVKINPPRIDSSVVVGKINRPIPVKQGVGRTVVVEHTSPDARQLPAGARSVITPVTPTDFLGNSKSDGSGVDRSAELAVSITAKGSRTEVDWSVTGSNNVWVRGPGSDDGFQLRGDSIVRDGELTSTKTRQASIDDFGVSDVVINAVYNFFPEYAEAMAASVADTFEGLTNFPIIVRPQTAKPAVLRKALDVDIGSAITVSEGLTAVDAATAIVYGVEAEISKDHYRVAWHVDPPLDTTAIENVDFGT